MHKVQHVQTHGNTLYVTATKILDDMGSYLYTKGHTHKFTDAIWGLVFIKMGIQIIVQM